MNFIALFMIIIGVFLIMIGSTIFRKVGDLNTKMNIKYIKYKVFLNVFVGIAAILTGIVQFLDKGIANASTGAFFIIVIIGISLDFILKRVFK